MTDDDDEDEGEDENDILQQKIAKTSLRRTAKVEGETWVIECVTDTNKLHSASNEQKEEIKENFRRVLKVDSLEGVDLQMLITAL